MSRDMDAFFLWCVCVECFCIFRCSFSCILPLCLHLCFLPAVLAAAAIPLSLFSPFFVFAITLFATVSTCTVHTSDATHTQTHTHSHTRSQYGYALPFTDARMITVREITVNICSMNMMRLAERRRGEERRIIYSVTSPCVAASLILFPPSLYTSLPISHSLPAPLFSCFTILPSLPLFIHVESFSCST